MMFVLKNLVATCVLALTVTTANANTFVTYDISGTFGNVCVLPASCGPSPANLSGTLTVDVTPGYGNPLSADLVISGLSTPFTIVENIGAVVTPEGWQIKVWETSRPSLPQGWLTLLFTTPGVDHVGGGGLVGFTGGGTIFDGTVVTCPTGDTCFQYSDLTGNLTPQVSQTPLPAALPLFATGLGVLGWAARRRKQKAAPLAA